MRRWVITFFAVPALLASLLPACGAPQASRRGFTRIDLDAGTFSPSPDQEQLIQEMGLPSVAWSTSYGTTVWVYCKDGLSTREVDFDRNGELLWDRPKGRTGLCPPGAGEGQP